MTSIPITAQLAALAAGEFAALAQPAVRHAARRHLMDTTGAVIAGMDQPSARMAAQVHAGLVAPALWRCRAWRAGGTRSAPPT